MGWRIVQGSGLGRRVCNSLASPILAIELHTRHPNPHTVMSLSPMFHVRNTVKALAGKTFSYASIGEAGEKVFPARAVGKHEPGMAASDQSR